MGSIRWLLHLVILIANSSQSLQQFYTNVIGRRIDTKFYVYWNAPTFQCRSHSIYFNDISEKFKIVQNKNDDFRGNQIAILYDPGVFPALLKNTSSNEFFYRNGGVPQQGDLEKHLTIYQQHVEELIPDPEFRGLAVIDFESWRPVFRQNFGVLTPYRDVSIELVRQQHPQWSNDAITNSAREQFETAARSFMENTLQLSQQLRPNAFWGYYGFPYCFKPNDKGECPSPVPQENDNINWLFELSNAYYPSMYLSESSTTNDRQLLIKVRTKEAKRIADKQLIRPRIIPYFWYKYRDSDTFLSKADLQFSLQEMKRQQLNGVVFWGSSNDVNTADKCKQLYDYVNNILGPIINGIV